MPGALSVSNRVQVAYKLEGTYPTNFGVNQAGNGVLVNFTQESLDYAVKNEQSKAIRSDRQPSDMVQVGASPSGSIGFEVNFQDIDPWLLGSIQNDWTHYGTAGTSAAFTGTLTLASGSITNSVAPTGNDAYTNLQRGQWFTVTPPAGATQTVKDYFSTRAFRVHSTTAPTTTAITLDPATPITTAVAGVSLAAGATITTSRAANGNVMKSYSLEVGHLDITQYRQYLGMIVSKVDLSVQSGAIITGSVDFMGKSMNAMSASSIMGTPTAAQTFTPANATKGVWDVLEGGTTISTTTYIKSMSISLDQSLRAQEAVGVFGNAGIAPGTVKITGKAQMYFADATIYNKLISGAASSISLPIQDIDGNGYVIHLPRIKYTAAKVGTGGLDQDNMLDVDFQAVMDTTAANATFGQTAVIYRI